MGSSLPPKEANLFKTIVKSYETKQYKKGLKAADTILKKLPEHGDAQAADISYSFINLSKGLFHAEPLPILKTDEKDLVLGVLKMLQGFSTPIFYWDENRHSFYVKNGIYASHLSETSLSSILDGFVYSGTCLKQVELFVIKVKDSRERAPTLEAFANSISLWLKRLRNVVLEEQMRVNDSDSQTTSTLLGLTNSISSICAGAEYLLQVVMEAIPSPYFESEIAVPAVEMAVHILDHLFKKLDEICLVQGGEEEGYHMLLAIFAGSLLPYLEGLDSWLYDGILDDPHEEMFFFANDAVAIDQPAFWERSYLLKPRRWRDSTSSVPLFPSGGEVVRRETGNHENILVPVFLRNMARAIVSAGKSLQLIRNDAQDEYVTVDPATTDYDSGRAKLSSFSGIMTPNSLHVALENLSPRQSEREVCGFGHSNKESTPNPSQISQTQLMGSLTLSEVFLVSLSGLLSEGCHNYEYSSLPCSYTPLICKSVTDDKELVKGNKKVAPRMISFKKVLFEFLGESVSERHHVENGKEVCSESTDGFTDFSHEIEESAKNLDRPNLQHLNSRNALGDTLVSFCCENPVITMCRQFLRQNIASWNELNVSRKFHLPPLNDEKLREAIFGETSIDAGDGSDQLSKGTIPRLNGTDYTFGFQFGQVERFHLEDDAKTLETLCPFPTLLPCFEEDLPMSELLPFQKNSTLASKILKWIQDIKLKDTSLPAVFIDKCLAVFIKDQVDHVGRHILLKLMSDWKLMDELGVLRAIYLLGSGDLLQQFLIVVFDKLDKGDPWDDDFELNTILQESIRNSADCALLSAPDSLVVAITKSNISQDEEIVSGNVSTLHKVWNHSFGIDTLDLLHFTYKVSWPLDLIANAEAIKKYNQVMAFLLKVKRAKFVLDKTRRWMWKVGVDRDVRHSLHPLSFQQFLLTHELSLSSTGLLRYLTKHGRGSTSYNHKHHLLVEQKLLHFVDAFHQYVMDRVFHSAWVELCTGMASAGSLDEVIEVHEAYLLSVQRQCFVAPDKLWALIASRIKSILGLALDFYSIQQTLSSGGAAPAIKARCEMEVDRIERQFDDCIAFLLRILSFKLNVGQFPHLADLVTRINYNYFYMSESGNLQTVPSFEAAAGKIGKTLVFRND